MDTWETAQPHAAAAGYPTLLHPAVAISTSQSTFQEKMQLKDPSTSQQKYWVMTTYDQIKDSYTAEDESRTSLYISLSVTHRTKITEVPESS